MTASDLESNMNNRTKQILKTAASVVVSTAFLVYSFSGLPGFEIAFFAFMGFFATHTFGSVCGLFDL
jgi:hypothetical protein